MPIIVAHANDPEDINTRRYQFSTLGLEEVLPQGVVLDAEAMTLLDEYFQQIQESVGFAFEIYESTVIIWNVSGDTWVGITNYIEPVIMQAVQDSVLRVTGLLIEVE